jgi:hypothetical protein
VLEIPENVAKRILRRFAFFPADPKTYLACGLPGSFSSELLLF